MRFGRKPTVGGRAMSEVVKVPGSRADVVVLIGSRIAAYRNGRGPWRKEEDLELGREWGLKLEKVAEKWEEAKREREAERPKRKREDEAEQAKPEVAKKISPTPQLRDEGKVDCTRAKPEGGGAQVEAPAKLRRRDVEALMATPVDVAKPKSEVRPEHLVAEEPEPEVEVEDEGEPEARPETVFWACCLGRSQIDQGIRDQLCCLGMLRSTTQGNGREGEGSGEASWRRSFMEESSGSGMVNATRG